MNVRHQPRPQTGGMISVSGEGGVSGRGGDLFIMSWRKSLAEGVLTGSREPDCAEDSRSRRINGRSSAEESLNWEETSGTPRASLMACSDFCQKPFCFLRSSSINLLATAIFSCSVVF